MKKLFDAIIEVFPDFDENTYYEDMPLKEIPDWDSMNSVNLQMAIEDRYNFTLDENAPLMGENTIKQLYEYIQQER